MTTYEVRTSDGHTLGAFAARDERGALSAMRASMVCESDIDVREVLGCGPEITFSAERVATAGPRKARR